MYLIRTKDIIKKIKDEALNKVMIYKSEFENQHNKKIKFLDQIEENISLMSLITILVKQIVSFMKFLHFILSWSNGVVE